MCTPIFSHLRFRAQQTWEAKLFALRDQDTLKAEQSGGGERKFSLRHLTICFKRIFYERRKGSLRTVWVGSVRQWTHADEEKTQRDSHFYY